MNVLPSVWEVSSSSDPEALAVVDGLGPFGGCGPHYSRRSPGSRTFTGCGQEVVLLTKEKDAVWAVVHQRTPQPRGSGGSRGRTGQVAKTTYVWRNMLFRNLGERLSSDLIRSAVYETRKVWREKYGELPLVPLRTEVDSKKIKSKNPGFCYLKAGWKRTKKVGSKVYLEAPQEENPPVPNLVTNGKPDYDTARALAQEKGLDLVVVSPSQLEDFAGERESCRRRWYARNVLKLPQPKRKSQARGTVLHAVVERWLRADDNGIDPETGKPVDLYPKDWDVSTERDGSMIRVEPAEAALIRTLVGEAITQGILRRQAGRAVEAPFLRPVVDHEGSSIWVVGYVDLLLPEAVEDHKTTKAAKWLKSARKIAQSTQMLVYARECLLRAREKGFELSGVNLTHIGYVLDQRSPHVRRTDTPQPVSSDDIEARWSWVEHTAREIAEARKAPDIYALPMPADDTTPCRAFGGCHFTEHCMARETADQHRNRYRRQQEPMATASEKLAALKNRGKAASAPSATAARTSPAPPSMPSGKPGAVAPPRAAPKKAAKKAAPKASPKASPKKSADVSLEASGSAPWAYADCTACEGTGISSKGNPCRACEMAQADGEGPVPSWFAVKTTDGILSWRVRAEKAGAVEEDLWEGQVDLAPVGTSSRVVDPEPEGEEEEEDGSSYFEPEAAGQDDDDDEEQDEEPEEETEDAPGEGLALEVSDMSPKDMREPEAFDIKDGPGRKVKSITLLRNCVPVKGPTSVVRLSDVLHKAGEQLAKVSGARSYWDLPAFKRREILAAHVPGLLEQLGKATVIVDGNSPDLEHLADALAPYASYVYEGTVR